MAITSWFLKRGVSLIAKLSLFIFILGLLLPSPCFSYSLPPDNTLRVELKWVDERANVYFWNDFWRSPYSGRKEQFIYMYVEPITEKFTIPGPTSFTVIQNGKQYSIDIEILKEDNGLLFAGPVYVPQTFILTTMEQAYGIDGFDPCQPLTIIFDDGWHEPQKIQYSPISEYGVSPDIKVNGSHGPITLSRSDILSITVSLDNNGQTDNADWWLAADTPFGLYFFTFDGWTDAWVPGYQGPLFYLDSFEAFNMPVLGLPAGTYTLYFGVDTVMDGNVTWDSVYYDTVEVNITE